MGRTESVQSSIASDDGAVASKGKGVDRLGTPPITIGGANEHVDPAASSNLRGISTSGGSQESLPSPFPSIPPEPARRSHLRHMSNASSSASSFADPTSTQTFAGSSTPPGGGAGMEPMFNFQSLAAMIGDEEKGDGSSHIEHQDLMNQGSTSEEGEEHTAGTSVLVPGHVSRNDDHE